MAVKPVQNGTQVTTGEVRLSYAHLFEPHSGIEGMEPRYSCVIMIPKSDSATLQAIHAAIDEAKEKGKSSRWSGKIPSNVSITLKDGDTEADLERNPEYEGHYYMNVASKQEPRVVDRNRQPILDASEVYSGIYARVAIRAFPYNAMGKKGVSFGLNHVQVLRDGEPFGGITRVEDVFDDLGDNAEDLF